MSSMTLLTVGGDHHTFLDGSSPLNDSTSATTYLLLTSTTTSPTKPVTTTKGTDHIAPKKTQGDAGGHTSVLRAKRKIQFATSGKVPAPPAVARRNERERNRVRQVNQGFATLKQHVPNGAKSKKMSKVETLRSAVQYIKQLQLLLNETTGQDGENSLPSFEEVAQMTIGHRQYGQRNTDDYPGTMSLGVTSPPCSTASSPNPSLGSEASSPYDSLSPEDEDLLDFSTWLS